MVILDRVIEFKYYYVLVFVLINVGFIFSFITGFSNSWIEDFQKIFILILVGLTLFDQLVYTPKALNWDFFLERMDWIDDLINHNYYLKFLKILFLISITIFPLCLGIKINDEPTKINLISQICFGEGLIIFYSSIIKYGYIFPNMHKRRFLTLIYTMIITFAVINLFYPNIFTKFLTIFSRNFMDLVVISLTFVLMTATLALLVFTYNTVLEHLKCKKILKTIGTLYCKSTIYVIIISIIAFSFFFLLRIVNIVQWDSLLTHDILLFLELNSISVIIILLACLMVYFLENFLYALWFSLEIFKLDCY